MAAKRHLKIPGTSFFDRYLDILGLNRRKPGYDALAEIVSRHVMRVPFESVSKLYYYRRLGLSTIPNPELYLDGIEKYHFGGTCYSNNYYLNRLLLHLGYDARLCGADMNNPDVHIVSMVTVENREYIIDVGYAAPFWDPLPRDLKHDHVVRHGNTRYELKPQDDSGCSRLELYRDGELRHSYLAKPIARDIEFFAPAIADSFSESSTFMNALLLVRFFPGRSLTIHNLTIVESDGSDAKFTAIDDPGDLTQIVAKHFAIPESITEQALDGFEFTGDAWS